MTEKLKCFEVSIYNEQVRELDKQNKSHPNYNREWAHLHFLTYEAETESDVIDMVCKKHPERKGFVIDKISEIKEYEFIKPVGRRLVVFKILCHSSKLYKKGMTYYDRNRI